MRSFLSIALSSLAIVVAGCTTHLSSGRADESSIINGVVYYLPRVDYDVKVNWILAACPSRPGGHPTFEATSKATAVAGAGDPVSINYEDLSSFSKTTDFTIELYTNGTLKSVNVAANDHTADILSEGVKAVVGIAKMSIGSPSLPSAASNGPGSSRTATIGCTEGAEQTLKNVLSQREAFSAANAASKAAAKAADDYEAGHKDIPRPANVTKEAAKLAATAKEEEEKADAAAKAVAESLARVTLTAQFMYSPGGPSTVLGPEAAQQGTITADSLLEFRYELTSGQWLVIPFTPMLTIGSAQLAQAHWQGKNQSVDARQTAEALWVSIGSPELDLKSPFASTRVIVDSAALSTQQSPLIASLHPAPDCRTDKSSRCGILYRMGAPSRTHICRVDTLTDTDVTMHACVAMHEDDPALLFHEDRSIPQLGRLASLPLRNGAFQNNTLVAEFSESGALIKVSYKKPDAEGVAIGKSINTGIDGATDIATYANGAKLRSLQNQKAIVDAQTSLATSTLTLATAQPSEVTKIDNETLLLNAEEAKVDAEIALRKKQDELQGLGASRP
jgi:hypothetical protein